MIDRFVDVNLDAPRLRRGAVPAGSPIFEGHFPGYPAHARRAADRNMAQTSGRLIMGVMNSRTCRSWPREKPRCGGFVRYPVSLLTIEAKLEHEGSGFAVTKVKGTRRQGTEVQR